MGIAFEHIVAGAGGGKQHDVACLRGGMGGGNGLRQGVAKLVRHVTRGEFGGDFGRVHANQEHGAGFATRRQARRSLALCLARLR